MKYSTFNMKEVDTDEIDHQHLSNIYWFNKIIFNQPASKSVVDRLSIEFNGKIMDYRPKPTFTEEISILTSKGLLHWRKLNGVDMADIIYNGHIVGTYIDINTQRDIAINSILD